MLLGQPLLQWSASALAEVCDELVIVAAKGQCCPSDRRADPGDGLSSTSTKASGPWQE